ncbi:putative toxin-antitoxin system toxin component, PIN family [Hippea alviniae]|uniref:putative toxin-antitoxin system toxin component, PIN family n=1 Tax=Hippea alviniae TaxID=1279027 RepID=UPI0003B64618|nr:putative toxin-antitoxin system toxin component, PIN family [Hippea alviniae]
MRVVIDTNVIVSGLLNPNGKPAVVINLLLLKKIKVLYDNRILKEYETVLCRDKFGFSREIVIPLIDFIKAEGEFVITEPIKTTIPDESDKKFLEVAISGKADYLITGNIRDYPAIEFIVTPGEFLKKRDEHEKI